MADRQPAPDLKNAFVQADKGYFFDLDRKMGAILDDMAVGYANALGSEKNMGLIVELHPKSHS